MGRSTTSSRQDQGLKVHNKLSADDLSGDGVVRSRALGPLLNIAMVSHRFSPYMGGTETHVREVGRRLAAMGHSVTVITADPAGDLPRSEVIDGLHVSRVPAFPLRSDLLWAPALRRTLAAGPHGLGRRWDVVHVQGYHTFFAPLAMAACKRLQLPFVVTFHSGGSSSALRTTIRGLQRRALAPWLRSARALIGVSQFEARLFAGTLGLPPDAIRVVPNGAGLGALAAPSAADSTFDPETPIILSVGRLERYKGHHRALDAFAEMVRIRPGLRLMIVGSGPYKDALEAQARRLGLSDKVSIGPIPPDKRDQMAALLRSAALCLCLSDYEAHPVAALEALSLGRPVLASKAAGYIEMVEQGLVHGVEPRAPASEIARRSLALIERGPLASSPPRLPDWDDCTQSLLRIYQQVAAPATSGTSRARPTFDELANAQGRS